MSACEVCNATIPAEQIHRRDRCKGCRSDELYCNATCSNHSFCCRGGCIPGWYCSEVVERNKMEYYCPDCLEHVEYINNERCAAGWRRCVDCNYYVIDPSLPSKWLRCEACFHHVTRPTDKRVGRICKACNQPRISLDSRATVVYCASCLKSEYCDGIKMFDGYRICLECQRRCVYPDQAAGVRICGFCVKDCK